MKIFCTIKPIKIICIIIFLAALLPFVSYGNGTDNNETGNLSNVIKKIEGEINSIKTYKQFIKTYEYRKLVSESVRYYKKPNKFNETTKIYANDGNVIISKTTSDGINIWTYAPFAKLVTKKSAKLNPQIKEVSFIPTIDSFSHVNLISEDKKFYIIEIIKRNNNLKDALQEKVKCYYRKDIGYPERIIFYDSEGKEATEMVLSYNEINRAVDDRMFDFTVPKGVAVTDFENQNERVARIGISAKGTKTTPVKILNEKEIIMQTDKFARDLGFDIIKCQKNIKKENEEWAVEYFNKLGNVSYKKITFLLNEQGQYLGVVRSPD